MIPRPPISTRADTLCPDPTLFRSVGDRASGFPDQSLREFVVVDPLLAGSVCGYRHTAPRSEEHTSELQSLMRTSYDVFCLKKKIPSKYTACRSQYRYPYTEIKLFTTQII